MLPVEDNSVTLMQIAMALHCS